MFNVYITVYTSIFTFELLSGGYGKEVGNMCLLEETLSVIDSIYLASMPGEIKDPIQEINV